MAWARSDRRRLWLRAAPRSTAKASATSDLEAFGQDALGLFDQDAAVQRGLQLFGDDVAAMDGALLQQADGGHVGQGLADTQLASSSAPASVSKKFSAPMISVRRRMGTACTAAKPTSAAAAVKRGQRPATGRSATETGWPVRKQSTQGPWSVCSWNSSSSRVRSEEAATTCSVPRSSVSSSPAAETPSSWTHRSVNTCRKSITIEVVDERVGHLHEHVG